MKNIQKLLITNSCLLANATSICTTIQPQQEIQQERPTVLNIPSLVLLLLSSRMHNFLALCLCPPGELEYSIIGTTTVRVCGVCSCLCARQQGKVIRQASISTFQVILSFFKNKISNRKRPLD